MKEKTLNPRELKNVLIELAKARVNLDLCNHMKLLGIRDMEKDKGLPGMIGLYCKLTKKRCVAAECTIIGTDDINIEILARCPSQEKRVKKK